MSAASSSFDNTERTSAYSPEKYYRPDIKKTKNGSPRVSLRLGGKKNGNFIYQFKNTITGEIYIGESRKLNSRVSAHISTANKSGKPSAKVTSQRLYNAIKANPSHFVFGILQVDGSPRKMEVAAINHYKNIVHRELYNCNRGGGGPRGKTDQENSPPINTNTTQPLMNLEELPPKSLLDDFEKLS